MTPPAYIPTSIRTLYENRLKNELKTYEQVDAIEREYAKIKKALHNVALQALGAIDKKKKKQIPFWATEEIEKLIEGIIGGSRSTKICKIVKKMKTTDTQQYGQLISMIEWENHYKKLPTENQDE
ncbi:hypothetical protein FQA39_LY02045 [Lamprigera yunnana]|nr:hypothetical protein FQA39_LY02045 [Lamprigera yunnana]